MEPPWFTQALIAASGVVDSPGVIDLIRARSLSITVEVTFGGSIDTDTDVELFYSPDGTHWDTYAYASFAITFDTSATEQLTKFFNVPEHGFMKIKITNGSSADTLTNLKAWYSMDSWIEREAKSHGDISTKLIED
jgi:hypothetical protein